VFKLPKDLIIIDIETTGTNPNTSSIIQLGAVLFSKEGYLVDRTFSEYIVPYTNEWTEEAYKVHKIEYSYLKKNGLYLPEALEAFSNWTLGFWTMRKETAKNYYLAQWSCGFDVSFLKEAYRKIGFEFPFHYRTFDIASIVRFELAKKGKLKIKSGESICAKELGIEVNGNKLHDALYDAQLSGLMLEKIIKENENNG